MPSVDAETIGGFSFVTGKLGDQTVVLTKSGMGPERAFRCARVLIESYKPSSIIIAGFAGGIKAGVLPGDIIVGTGLLPMQSTLNISGKPQSRAAFSSENAGMLKLLTPDGDLLHKFLSIRFLNANIHKGMILAVPSVLQTPEMKRGLKTGGAKAVDMESLATATACNSKSIPWIVVRVITDGIDDSLPLKFEDFVDSKTGEVSISQLATHVLLHPRLIPPMMELGKRSKLASKNLADFLKECLN